MASYDRQHHSTRLITRRAAKYTKDQNTPPSHNHQPSESHTPSQPRTGWSQTQQHFWHPTGFEMQFGTDHLGHFALTGLLLPALLRRPVSRVVTVSSFAHVMGRIDFDDLQGQRRYGKWAAYAQAKLANLLFALELDRWAKAAGVGLLSVAAHPGYAATNLQTTGPKMEGREFVIRAIQMANQVFAQSASAGALPILYAATAPGLRGGEFFGPNLLMRGYPAPAWRTPAARNRETARRLWTVSEQLTGVSFDLMRPPSA